MLDFTNTSFDERSDGTMLKKKTQCVKSNKIPMSFTEATYVLLAYRFSISSLSQFDQLITLDHFNSSAPVPPL